MGRTRKSEDEDILCGWKEIAKLLGCSTKSAMRKEDTEHLPVFRLENSPKSSVFASKRAINAWLKHGIERAVLIDNRLIAIGSQAKILWSHEFEDPLSHYTKEELEWRLRIIDLRGGGNRGVLIVAHFLISNARDQVLYFSPDGEIEWVLEPKPALLKSTGESFEDAWVVKHLIPVSAKAGTHLYLAMANAAGWGGCVLRIDASGRPGLQFANAGYVERLCSIDISDEGLLIACGENNDFDCAFVALLGLDDPCSVSIPGLRTVYRFANAPSELPRKYILFPKTELIFARNKPYGHAQHLRQYQDRIIIEVETGGDGGHFLYHFTDLLEPLYVFPSGSHEFFHQALEISGAIKHPWSQCSEVNKPLLLQVWTRNSGWQDQEIGWRDHPWKDDCAE
jgi:hypothetical protein